jgi:predicted MPP superfamily phosphohydrolase
LLSSKAQKNVRRIFLSLMILLPIYVGWRLLSAFDTPLWGVASSVAALIAVCTVLPMLVRTRAIRDPAWADRLSWLGSTAMGFFSSLLVLTVLRDILLLVVKLVAGAQAENAWRAPSAVATLLITALVTAIGMAAARGRPRIVKVEIPVTDLPEGLRGFSIAQISDVHVGPTIKRPFVEQVVSRVNALRPDMIAVTGDLVDGSVLQLAAHTAPLAGLAARHGAFFVTGNHEYYSGERAWTSELRRLGLRVLKNEHVVLQHNGAALVLAGVTDFTAHHFDPAQQSDPAKALNGAPAAAGAKILLAHQPSTAEAAATAGFDVQLSGHTHGGQFWPWNLFVGFFQPFTGGLHRLRDLWVYVNRGTGYWGPPNRFGVPSEITHIRLVPAAP